MRHFMITATYLLILLGLFSCSNWGWESIETDNEAQLNVFGLISLDDSLESFVVVHKTLDTAGPDEIVVGQDIYGYPVYESLYVVKDAIVSISDGSQEFLFERNPSENSNEGIYWYGDIFSDPAMYTNVDQSFVPRPNTLYSLHISTPDGLELTGAVTTPALPTIREDDLADTVSIKNLFEVSWYYAGDYSTTITTDRVAYDGTQYICGMNQFGIIEAGDTTWNSKLESWCYEGYEPDDPNINAPMDIRLRFLDENYYNYFLATDDVAAISNFLIGEGGIGSAYGVEGGFGVFGAVSADWTRRIATP